ncbi:MAG: NTP transferase domain-containing protein [Myxococcota bacterium]|nr:NTP transferase domain-containing protein [Myxococcota bacterium]
MSDQSQKPKIAVILAAGLGSRLHTDEGPPKPLTQIGKRALILRVLDRFFEAGVSEAVVVLGHRADEVRAGIDAGSAKGTISFVHNPRYTMGNGLSVLAARSVVKEQPFFLSMSDHIFDSSLIEGLARAPLPKDGLVLAVDRKLDSIYDMDDATKVLTNGDRIVKIHKALDVFDAVDTGLFMCTPALFDAIDRVSKSREDRDCSLSDGVKALANADQARVYDVGNGRWQDVDTPGSLAHAEGLFLNQSITTTSKSSGRSP